MTLTAREVERKYDGDGTVALPPLDDLPGGVKPGEPVEATLEATYFDTADLRLAARGVRLRRRAGGTDEGWHLKVPSGAGVTIETHAALGRATRTVPRELATLVDATTRGAALVPTLRMK